VTERTRNIMVRGWVWWREPFPKVLPQLVPYKDVSGCSVSIDEVKESRTFDLVYVVINVASSDINVASSFQNLSSSHPSLFICQLV
jgi:hypothetical protein